MIHRRCMAARGQPNRHGGLSLIELIVFIVIVSVAIAGVLSVLNLTVSKSADPMIRKQALAVAEAMLEEILTKDYQNDPADPNNTSATLGCTPTTPILCRTNTVSDRQNYNDVDDYNTWSQASVYQLDGALAPGLGSYSVNVGVLATTLNGVAAKQVTVTVANGAESISLVGFRTYYE